MFWFVLGVLVVGILSTEELHCNAMKLIRGLLRKGWDVLLSQKHRK